MWKSLAGKRKPQFPALTFEAPVEEARKEPAPPLQEQMDLEANVLLQTQRDTQASQSIVLECWTCSTVCAPNVSAQPRAGSAETLSTHSNSGAGYRDLDPGRHTETYLVPMAASAKPASKAPGKWAAWAGRIWQELGL